MYFRIRVHFTVSQCSRILLPMGNCGHAGFSFFQGVSDMGSDDFIERFYATL